MNQRRGKQRGSVYLADQKVPLMVPRVRDLKENREIPLSTYRGQTSRRSGSYLKYQQRKMLTSKRLSV